MKFNSERLSKIMKENKICIYPGCSNFAVHSSYCRAHDNMLSSERHRRKYSEFNGMVASATCQICGKSFRTTDRDNKYCSDCFEKIKSVISANKYSAHKRMGIKHDEHRLVAQKYGLLSKNSREVVHHIDLDKSNNNPDNLLVLGLSDHGKLHSHLRVDIIKHPDIPINELTWDFIADNNIPYGYHEQTDDRSLYQE